MRKSICDQAENGFAAYFNANILGTNLQGVTGYAAHTVTPKPLDGEGNPTGFENLTAPFVVFAASSPLQLGFDSGIYELTLTAHLEVQIDESQAIPGTNLYSAYMEALRDLLETPGQVYNWLNSSSPINFTNFGLSSIVYQKERLIEQPDSRCQMAEIEYYLAATTNPS